VLIAAAKAPKVVNWIESGHILPPTEVRKGLDWLALRLKLPAAADRYAAPEAAKLSFAPVEDPEARVEKVSFTNAAKETVSGLYVRPKDGTGPFPLVLVLHGRGHSKEKMLNTMKREFASRGVAAIALDAAGHGDRRPALDYEEIFSTTVKDYRQLLPNLLERPELNAEKVGLIGFSMGAMLGTILAAVDERIRATLPCVGGDVEALPESCRPALFAPYLTDRPVAFINGHNDPTVPEASAKRLHTALGASANPTVFWYDEADHTIPKPTLRLGTDWLMERLK
jgi:dienelactone hydrolase